MVDLDTATSLMSEAFATWEGARCGDEQAPPSITVSPAFGPAVCGQPQYNPHSGNANLVVFRDDAWPYTSAGHELAATTITFDDDGVIYDADLEINALGPLTLPMSDDIQAEQIIQFGIIPDQHDLLSIMVHEAGHFLGLDHSREENSVMTAELSPGQVRTSLAPDDIAAICELYPPDRETAACDPAPHGGFSAACDETPIDGGCSLQRHDSASAIQLAMFGAVLTALHIRRMRRRSDR